MGIDITSRLPDRYNTVQALRFVAAFVVVITHASLYTSERFDSSIAIWHPGESGVDFFFVISGFVMVLTLADIRGNPVDWREFLAKRAIRIVPLYWLATFLNLAVLIAVPSLVLHSGLDWIYVAKSLAFIPAYGSDGTVEPLLGVGWTLLFEVFFYLILTVSLGFRVSAYVLVPVILLACSVGYYFRGEDWPAWAFYLNPLVLEFLYGMLLARFLRQTAVPPFLAALGLVIGLGLFYLGTYSTIPNFISVGLPAALVVGSLVALEPVVGQHVPKWMILLGSASYSIYLFHPLIAPAVPMVAKRLSAGSPALVIVLAVLGAVCVGTLIHMWVERPLLRWLSGIVFARRQAERALAPK